MKSSRRAASGPPRSIRGSEAEEKLRGVNTAAAESGDVNRTVELDEIVAANNLSGEDDDSEPPVMPKLSARLMIHAVLGMALAAVMIAALPWFTHTSWARIGHHLNLVGPQAALECIGIML